MRMVASLQVLARDEGLTSAKEADRAVRAALDGYRGGIAQVRRRPVPRHLVRADHGRGSAQRRRGRGAGGHRRARLHKRARKRSNVGAAKKFTEVVDGRVRLVEAPPFRVRDDRADRAIVEEVVRRVSLVVAGGAALPPRPLRLRRRRPPGGGRGQRRDARVPRAAPGRAPGRSAASCRSSRPGHRCTRPSSRRAATRTTASG